MKKRLSIILFLFLPTGPAWAEPCLHVGARQVEVEAPGELDTVSVAVNWRVELENRCDARFTADLTIRFLDAADSHVYEVRGHATVGVRERVLAEQRVFIPRRHADKIEGISVQIDERKLEL